MEGDREIKPRQPKRKQRNQAEWKREKRKRLIIAGETHLSVKGELVESKQIGADCKCKLKCYEKIPESTRQMLFDGFYALKSYDEQNAYLFGLIRKHDIKRKKNIQSDRRTCTYKYYIRNKGKEILVCKLAFAHIHAISFRKIRTLSEKLDLNILFPRDGRGKHDNRPKRVSPDTVNLISSHIFSIIKSNELKSYMKEDKSYPLTSELNVAKLYTNFLQVNETEAIDCASGQINPGYTPKVKSWLYRKVFHDEVKPKDYQLIRKRLEALNKVRGDGRDPTASDVEVEVPKKSRRKGMARKIESNGELLHIQPKPVQYPILAGYVVSPQQPTEIQGPCLTSVPLHKPMQQHHVSMYQQDHLMQEFSTSAGVVRANKDNRVPQINAQHQMIVIGGSLFEHRMHQYQDEGHGSQQVIDINEMNNAFLYSSNC